MSFKDGRIGVGKDPIFPLDISGSCRIDGDLILGGRFSDSQGNPIQLGSGSGATSTPDQNQDGLPSWSSSSLTTVFDGNVGIGTTSPDELLHVNVNTSNTAEIYPLIISNDYTFGFNTGNDIGCGIGFKSHWKGDGIDSPTVMTAIESHKESSANFGDSYLSFKTRRESNRSLGGVGVLAERMRIDSTGNVGIGTDSPGEKLEVNGKAKISSNVAIGHTNSPITRLDIRENGGPRLRLENTSGDYSAQNGAIEFCTTYSTTGFIHQKGEAMRIGVTGSVSTLRFYTYNNTGYPEQNGNTQTQSFFNETYTSGNDNPRMVIDETGNVGIGTTSPDVKLEINDDGELLRIKGTTRSYITFYKGTTYQGFFGQANSANDNIYMAALNGSIVFQESGGNVGIGTTSPDHKLEIYESTGFVRLCMESSTTGKLLLGTNNDGRVFFWNEKNSYMHFGTNNTERMRITGTGNVGIGTTSPTACLHVKDNVDYGEPIARFEAYGDAFIMIDNNNAGWGEVGVVIKAHSTQGYWLAGTDDTSTYQIKYDSSDFHFSTPLGLSITTDGKVGIGTTSPYAKLHINDGYLLISENTDSRENCGGVIGFYTTDMGVNGSGTTPIQAYIGTRTHSYDESLANQRGKDRSEMVFYIGNNNNDGWGPDRFNFIGSEYRFHAKAIYPSGGVSQDGKQGLDNICGQVSDSDCALFIATNGNVGIGTTGPKYPLDVDKSSTSTDMTYWNRGGFNDGAYFATASMAGLSGSNYGQSEIGDLDSGTTYPTASIGLQTIAAHFKEGIYISDGALYVSSDERIKTNIVDVSDNIALEMVRNIPCRYYNYKDKISRGAYPTIGFIAQEVRQVLPMAVSERTQFIPNVMRNFDGSWNNNTLYTDLSDCSGIKYRFYVGNDVSGNDEIRKDIIGNSNNSFTFDTSYNNVFCYGKEVDDFHTLDKNKLFALNFSATQELDRKVTALETVGNQDRDVKILDLYKENEALKARLAKIEAFLGI